MTFTIAPIVRSRKVFPATTVYNQGPRIAIPPDPLSRHHLSFDSPFDKPSDKLTVLTKVEGLTALSRAEGLRYDSSFVIAAYLVSTPHSSRFASLAFEAFYCAVPFLTFWEFISFDSDT